MNAQQLKNSILQEAIEGRLVPQDPNDEPASVLLERIRKEKARLVKEGKLKKKDLEEIPISEDEKRFNLPKHWKVVRLGEITYNHGQKTPSVDFSYIDIGSIDNKYQKLNDTDNIVRAKDAPSRARKIVKRGDVIYATVRPYLHNICIIDRDFSLEPIASTGFAVLSCIDGLYNKFLFYYLLSPPFDDYANDGDNAKGMAYPAINDKKLYNGVVPLPPLAEQKRIVAKIEELLPKVEAYGKAQESLDKLNEELPERLKKSILQEAIEGRLMSQDPNDEPASVLLDKIRAEKKQLVKEGKLKKKDLEEIPISEDEIPFKIPESWEWVRLGEISTYSHTKKKINASKAAPNIWGLDLEDIEKGGKLLYIKSVGERKAIGDKTCFEEGDILYSKLRPYLLKILIAPQNGICTPEIIPFTCYGNICKDYIVNLLKSVYVDRYINSATFGIKMPRVATETMTSLIIPLPPLAEQKRIVEKIEQLFGEIDKLKK